MNSYWLRLILLSCLVIQTGCDITFKRKSESESSGAEARKSKSDQDLKDKTASKEKKETEKKSVVISKKADDKKPGKSRAIFSRNDEKLITLYYTDEGNAKILDDMVKHTWITKKRAKKLTTTERIPNDVQVMPLPLELEKILSPLPRYAIRVQIGKRVIIMDIKSRRILDVIKI